MFERYTEKARRTIFFARYEASQAGSPYIETEHLLLGLLRESSGIARQHLKVDRSKLANLLTKKRTGSPISTSVDLPLDNASKRALAYAAQEADQLGHKFIGPEHLLLGVMHEEQSGAAKALKAVGAPSLAEVRKSISESSPEDQGRGVFAGGSSVLSTWVKFIEADTGRELSARLGFEAAPRVGEAVIVTAEGGAEERFRVEGVEWKFDLRPLGKDLTLKVVEVRLRREEPAH
jgi:ATP-dependent Clp protease ATP-binding subunit ClpA